MTEIDIRAADEHVYDVTITDDHGAQSRHRVTVPLRLLDDLGVAASQEPSLVRASMVYLLEREPPSSVLGEFTLDDITRYFPGFPDEIPARL